MPDMARVAVSMFIEMSESDEPSMKARLGGAGFDDIGLGDVLLLSALQMRSRSPRASRGRAQGAGRVSPEMTDRLRSGGYLNGGGPPAAELTARGRQAVDVVLDGVLADRWTAFPFRPGDIVVSTPGKCGTTWMQMICALLVHQIPELPAPLNELSPWLDDPTGIRDEIFGRYAAQRHRRIIKTHTSVADLPDVAQVTYVVVGRHPLDAAVSSFYQQRRTDLASGSRNGSQEGSAREWLLDWISEPPAGPDLADHLDGILTRLSAAWHRRAAPNVVLTHYDDLSADLECEMRVLSGRLEIPVDEARWPELVRAATFEHMRAAADRIEPFGGLLADSASFFRRGGSGAGAELLTPDELAGYHARVARVLEPDLLAWLHRAA